MQFRKKAPIFEEMTSDIDEEQEKMEELTEKHELPEHNRYMRKNFREKGKKAVRLKINEITECNRTVSCRGQVIFIWEKQKINEKWAKTQMVCIEIYDGTGYALVAIPEKHLDKLKQELQFDQWVEVTRALTREKYPKSLCLLISDKSTIEIHPRGSHAELSCEPEKLGITLKELEMEPVGAVRNVVCMVLEKQNKQFIKSSKGNELILTHIRVFDPRYGKSALVKLWEEKTDLRFFCGMGVYLLRGVEVKQYKGEREYDSTKEFTFRCLQYSAIENYLRPYLEVTERLLKTKPKDLGERTAHEQTTPKAMLNREISEASYQKREDAILNKATIQWAIQYIRLTHLEIDQKFPKLYCLCSRCGSKTMIDHREAVVCFTCGFKKGDKHYAIKMEYSDEANTIQCELRDAAAEKLLTLGTEPLKVEFYESAHLEFKKKIMGEITGNVVKGVIATVCHQLSHQELVRNHYLVDILPFDDDAEDSP